MRHRAGAIEINRDHTRGFPKHQPYGPHEGGFRQLADPINVVGGVAPIKLRLTGGRVDGSLHPITRDQPPIGIDGLELR